MTDTEYFDILALSNSGMKDLAVSPLRYWHRNINPDRPAQKPSPEMIFGSAVHCLVLEGEDRFNQRYGRALDEEEIDDCLVTVDDLRNFLRLNNQTPKGSRKSELIQQVQDLDDAVPILDVLKEEHAAANADKTLLSVDDCDRVYSTSEALLDEPKVRSILAEGMPEVALVGKDKDTGIPLKAKLDWLAPKYILDLKTFRQSRGKSMDQSVADAIYFEKYYRQAFFYAMLHQQIAGLKQPLKFVFAFVESDPPHEVRLRELRPTNYEIAALNEFWQRAQIEVRYLCRLWNEYMSEFGTDTPWRREQEIELLLDEEMKGMAFA